MEIVRCRLDLVLLVNDERTRISDTDQSGYVRLAHIIYDMMIKAKVTLKPKLLLSS